LESQPPSSVGPGKAPASDSPSRPIRPGDNIRPDTGIFSVYELDQGLLIAHLVRGGHAAGLRGPQETRYAKAASSSAALIDPRRILIVAVDGRAVHSMDDLLSYVESIKAPDQIVVTIHRVGRRLEVAMKRDDPRHACAEDVPFHST